MEQTVRMASSGAHTQAAKGGEPVCEITSASPSTEETGLVALLSSFFKDLRSSEPSADGVITLNIDQYASQCLGFFQPCPVRFVCRREYEPLLRKIVDNWRNFSIVSTRAIVTGTSGIGKSFFRFYVIREWLCGRLVFEGVDKICFNLFGSSYFHIDMEANVTVAPMPPYGWNVVAVLDPCSLLENCSGPPFRLTIVTASLERQVSKCNLWDFQKYAAMFQLGHWPLDEFNLLGFKVDSERAAGKGALRSHVADVPEWLYATAWHLLQARVDNQQSAF